MSNRSSAESLIAETQKSVREIEQRMGEYDLSCRQNDEQKIGQLDNYFNEKIKAVSSNCSAIDARIRKESLNLQGQLRLRVNQIQYDVRHLEASLRSLRDSRQRQLDQRREREELMRRDFTSPHANSHAPGSGSATFIFMQQQHGHNQHSQDEEVEQHRRVVEANRRMDTLLDSGWHTLSRVQDQGRSLHAVRDRLTRMFSQMSVSESVTRLISARAQTDAKLFYAGVAASLLFMFLVWFYFIRG